MHSILIFRIAECPRHLQMETWLHLCNQVSHNRVNFIVYKIELKMSNTFYLHHLLTQLHKLFNSFFGKLTLWKKKSSRSVDCFIYFNILKRQHQQWPLTKSQESQRVEECKNALKDLNVKSQLVEKTANHIIREFWEHTDLHSKQQNICVSGKNYLKSRNAIERPPSREEACISNSQEVHGFTRQASCQDPVVRQDNNRNQVLIMQWDKIWRDSKLWETT